MIKCYYGCGLEAINQLKNGRWCCSKYPTSCPIIRKKNSKVNRGHKVSIKTRKKISEKNLGKSKKKLSKNIKEKYRKITLERYNKKPWIKEKIKKTMLKIFSDKKNNEYKKMSIEYIKNKYTFFSNIEKMRYEPGTKNIQVNCKNHKCKNSKEKGGWFTPTYIQLYERIRQLENDNGSGGSYFYCSDECKQECPLFNVKSDPNKKTEKEYTLEEYNIWRQEVFKRADNRCEYCDEKATHAHHSRPQKLEPIFILDPDYGIACCKKCHYKYGHKTGTECSTGNLASIICK